MTDRPHAVTAYTHPTLFKAFEMISHDGGDGAGWSSYHIPDRLRILACYADLSLARLTPEQLETFCIGEVSEQEALAKQFDIQSVSDFLAAFFDGDWSGDTHPERLKSQGSEHWFDRVLREGDQS